MTPGRRLWRVPLVGLAVLSLAAASWGGLLRLGWSLAVVTPTAATFHGPLMVSGFLGTVISLERAVASGRWWTYVAPLATGLGAIALIADLPEPAGKLLLTAGSAVGVAVFGAILRRQPALFTWIMAAGTVIWLVGQLLWLAGWPIYRVVFWWAGFVVLTIVGERVDLARLVRPSAAARTRLVMAVALLLAALIVATASPDIGVRLVGVSFVALSLWLGRQDVARRTVHQGGMTRFIALCLLSGYVWLGVAGVLMGVWGDVAAGPRYDAMLHALFLGFVFSIIFGHAPIILPAMLGGSMSYRPAFYAHVAVLHLGLLLRLAGDVVPWFASRRWGGLLNVLALLLFLGSSVNGLREGSSPSGAS